MEKAIGCVKYYSIHLYLLGVYTILFQGIPTVLNLLQLVVLSFLIIRQICYKESILQWYIVGIFFILLFCVKWVRCRCLTTRYVAMLPVVNSYLLQFFNSFSFIQNGTIHLYELGFIPESACVAPL